MSVAPEQGSKLLLPLLRLTQPPQPQPDAGPRRQVPRLLHLDERLDEGLAAWVLRVRTAAECCLVVDEQGRVAAMSPGCAGMLDLDPTTSTGALLLDLLVMVDFSALGVPIADPEMQTPCLRALKSGGLARGLVRLRRRGVLHTYDVVGVPLAERVGALAFLTEV